MLLEEPAEVETASGYGIEIKNSRVVVVGRAVGV